MESARSTLAPQLVIAPQENTDRKIEVERARRKVFIPVHARRSRRNLGAALLLGDALIICLAIFFKAGIRLDWVTFLAFGGPTLLTLYIAGAYRMQSVMRHLRLKTVCLTACGGFFVGMFCYKVLLAVMSGSQPVIHYTVAGLIAGPLFALWATFSRWAMRRMLLRLEARSKLLFIGPYAIALEIQKSLSKQSNTHPLVVFDDTVRPIRSSFDEPQVMTTATLDEHLAGSVKAIVLATPPNELSDSVMEDLVHARLLNIPIMPPSLLIEELWERTPVTMADQSWFLQSRDVHPSRTLPYQGLKRVFDIVAAFCGLIVATPIMMLTAIAVRAGSRGPILFRQTRVGLWKETFVIYKFRTMCVDAEPNGAQWATKNDPRVTRIGAFLRKTRLDELPQLWNVLIGQMSIVGPRPERPEFNTLLEKTIPYYDLRHLVKPGITGWAQVCYPYGSSIDDAIAKLEYEIYYIKNASLRFDTRILMRTLGIMLGLRGR